jgi:hypothetical protein
MFHGDSALGRLVREALTVLLDALVKSPLEQDFSETADWEVTVPEARHAVELPPDAMAERLARLCAEVAGFSEEHAGKIGGRMRELPEGMFADYRYQIADAGSTAELQIRMTKRPENLIAMELRSSEAVIGAVRMAFRAAHGDEEEDPDE